MFIFMFRTLCCSVLQAIAFKGKGKAMSDFALTYSQYPALHGSNTNSLHKNIFWRITVMHIFIFIAVISHSTIFFIHNTKSNSSTALLILISSFNAVLLYVMHFPPSVAGKQGKCELFCSLSKKIFFQ